MVKGSDPTKLKYKLTNIQLEYEMIRCKMLADEASSVYDHAKEYVYDHVSRYKIYPINRETDTKINITVNSQRRSMKGLLLLFVEPYVAGARDSEKYIFPNLKKVRVTINGSPNMLYNNGIESQDIWKPQYTTLQKFYIGNKFGLLIDLRMAVAPVSSTPQTASSWKSIETPREQKLLTPCLCHHLTPNLIF